MEAVQPFRVIPGWGGAFGGFESVPNSIGCPSHAESERMNTRRAGSGLGQMTDTETTQETRPAAAGARANSRSHRTWVLAWPTALFFIITCFVAADMAADIAAGT